MAILTELQRWSMQGLASLPEVARALGEALPHGGVVAIHGVMGAGKTTLVRQILASWNVEEEGASPTFGLVHHHAVHREGVALEVRHMDLYRLETRRAERPASRNADRRRVEPRGMARAHPRLDA